MKMRVCSLGAIALAAGLAVSTSALAQPNWPETEPNDAKFTGNAVGPMSPGDTITGNSTGTSTTVAGAASADNYLVTVAAPPSSGIWRYRLVISTAGTAGHTGSIRGLTQTAGVINAGTDTAFQTSSTTTTPARFNQWYGLGGGTHQLYYRVTGGSTTTTDYVSTLERVAVTPQAGPSTVIGGNVTISTIGQGHTTDTDFWVYDSNFNPVATFGNDDNSIAGGGTGTGFEGICTRALTPGTYYVAMTNFGFANNQPAPADDDFRTGGVMDFANVASNSSTSLNVNCSFAITGGDATVTPVSVTRAGAFDVVWVQFTVVPPSSPTNPTGSGTATPASAANDGTGTTTLAVTVVPGQTPTSTAHTVTVTSSALVGGSVSLLDNGVAPDVAAGDLIFTGNATIANGTPIGATPLPFTIQETAPLARSGSGSINFTVILPPPTNDVCSSAITVSTGTTVGDNSQATTDSSATCQSSSNKDLWYSFTAATAGAYTFDTEGSVQADTVLSIFDACGGTELACDDDSGTGLLSTFTFTMTAGQNVKIRLASFGAAPAGGVFNLNINPTIAGACCNDLTGACTLSTNGAAGCAVGTTYQGDNTVCSPSPCPASGSCCDPATGACLVRIETQCVSPSVWTSGAVCSPNPCPPPPPPANDACAAAIVIPSVGTPAVTGNNAAATTDGAATCQTLSNKDMWYTFTAPAAGSYQMDTEGSAQGDTVLNVFDVCGGTELACDDDSGTGLLSVLLINLTSGQTVTIRIASFGSAPAGGGFNININSVTTGACCNDLTGVCTLRTGSVCLSGETYQGDSTVCTPSPCPASGSCCDPGTGTCLVRVQAQCASPSVWTSGGVCTPNPCPQPPPPSNDTCATAIVVNGNSVGSAATQFALNENDEPAGTCNTTGAVGVDNSIWFTFTSSTGGQLSGTLNATDYDSVAVLYTGTCGAATLTEVACWDEPEPMDLTLPDSGSSLLTAGVTYYLVIGDWGVTDGGGAQLWDITVPGGVANGRCCVGARCAIVTAANCTASGASGASFTPAATDCNATGILNTPCCFADYNKVGGVTVQDIFDFLTDWFSGNVNANVGGDGIAGPSVQDIFDFLTAWFSGCA